VNFYLITGFLLHVPRTNLVHSSPDQKLEKSHEDPKKNEEISKSIVLRRAKIIMIWNLGIK